jgi:hypothetical protein
LGESIEDDIQLVLLDSDTRVGHTEFKFDGIVHIALDSAAERYLSLAVFVSTDLYPDSRRELDGVTNKIGDNLAQPQWVTDKLVWNGGIDVVDEIQTVLLGFDAESLQDAEHGETE